MGRPSSSRQAASPKEPRSATTSSHPPSWSTSPLTKESFAHEAAPYVLKLDPRYKFFIEYGAAHEKGVTICASKQHISDILNNTVPKGSPKQPCVYDYKPGDALVSDESEESGSSSDDEGEDLGEPTARRSKFFSKPKAPPSPSMSPSKELRKRFRVDCQHLITLDLELANDIVALYEHDETGVEHIEEHDSSGRSILQHLFTPLTEQEGACESTPLDRLQEIDREGINDPSLVAFNDFRTKLKLQNKLIVRDLQWSDQMMATRLEKAVKKLSPSIRSELAVEMRIQGATSNLSKTKMAITKVLTQLEVDLADDKASGLALATKRTDPRRHPTGATDTVSDEEKARRLERKERFAAGGPWQASDGPCANKTSHQCDGNHWTKLCPKKPRTGAAKVVKARAAKAAAAAAAFAAEDNDDDSELASECDPDEDSPSHAASDGRALQSIVGALLYCATNTRPDVAYAVGMLCRAMSRPTPELQAAALRVLGYLHRTKDLGLRYEASDKQLYGMSDSDWGVRHSTTGWTFQFCQASISWGSKKQGSVALSSCEAEIMAASEAAKEAVHLDRMAKDLGLSNDEPLDLFVDNQSAIAIAYNPELHQRTKHIERRHFFVREVVENEKIRVPYVRTVDNLADFFTKPLQGDRFFELRDRIMNVQ